MRHSNHNRKFGRMNDQRRALLRSLAEGLMNHGKIETTIARAKEMRPFIERLITKGRTGSVADIRLLIRELGTKARTVRLIKDVAPKYKERSGGYTRIVKLPRRIQDGSPMAIIEFV